MLEAAALFFILFFPATQSAAASSPDAIITQSLFWRVPAIVLIILLLENQEPLRIKTAFFTLAAALPALALTGFLASFFATRTGYLPPEPIAPPSGAPGWAAAVLLSFSTGYLEEAYFRVYLPRRFLDTPQASSPRAIAAAFTASGIIFALCHAYEGPFGILNAGLAAAVLSLAYIKSSSFHGIALAHGFYNCLVFLGAAFATGWK
jgi:membrane protease YdiL (CAAX protease family)